MKNFIRFIPLFLLGLLVSAQAQSVGSYTFSNAVGNYTPLSGDSTITLSNFDDAISSAINIGFNFTLGSQTFTQFKLNSNGWITFRTASTSTTQYSVLSSSETQVIAAFSRDLNGSVAAGSKYSILRTGSSPNQILKIQFKNLFSFSSTTVPAIANMQIWLYQTSNVVEVHYGAFAAGTRTVASTVQVGLKSGSTAIDSIRSVSGTTWPTAAASNSSTATVTISTTVLPDSNRVFTFTPPLAPTAIDVGVISAVIGAPGQIISVGKGYDIVATVKNFGTLPQAVVPVSYTVNGGAPVGPAIAGPIPPGGTANATFTGGNAFTPVTPGINVIKIFTQLIGDTTRSNDTLTVLLNVQQKITSYPYVQTFTNPVDWTTLIENAVGTTPLWGLGICVNPAGKVGDTAATSNCYNGSAGRREVLRSPEMDLSSLTNPVLDFYVAYRTFSTEDDSMEVVVSTNGGVTFFSASTVYNKANSSIPSLATRPASTTAFFPDSSKQWRHETVNLANVSGLANVVIGFRSKSQFGNRQWIDNVIVTSYNNLCTDTVRAPGIYSCNSLVSINMITVGLRPTNIVQELDNNISKIKSTGMENVGSFPTFVSNGPVISGGVNQTDHLNPSGGALSTTSHLNQHPPSLATPEIAPNTTATNPSGGISSPNVVYNDYWFTVTYTGNDKLGYATYNISIDVTTFTNTDSVYIVKRADETAPWVCLSTTLAGSFLTASGLTTFSDFALAGDSVTVPLPVELSAFTSTINLRDVTLNWTTVSESNNSGFDVERSSVNSQWSKIGNVTGSGTSNNIHNYSFTDRGLSSGKYNYRLKQTDFNGNFHYYDLSNEVNVGIPDKFNLSQNYPNPFNPSTKINYDIPFDSKVSIKLFDMSGKEVATLVNEPKAAGYYTINFNASSLSSGVYFYRISAEANGQSFVSTKKMILVK